MTENQYHTAPETVARTRMSDYLPGLFPELPTKNAVKKALKAGRVYLDDQLATTADWVLPGARIELRPTEQPPPKVWKQALEIILRDDHLAVVLKPAGMTVSGNKFRTLQNALLFNLPPSTAPGALAIPRPVHRLDHPTSGLLLIARTAPAAVHLSRQFEERQVHKRYHAIVAGSHAFLPEQEFELNEPLDGKVARTRGRCLETMTLPDGRYMALLLLYPETGRTHQLRRHLAGKGSPILGDKDYGPQDKVHPAKGLLLAATGLRFLHPQTVAETEVTISPPAKFSKVMHAGAFE